MSASGNYISRNAMKLEFRAGRGVYQDGQSSFSVNCQSARARGRRPLSEAIKIVRSILKAEGFRVSENDARTALIRTHDGEWHHTSKFGNRTSYYDPAPAIELLRANHFCERCGVVFIPRARVMCDDCRLCAHDWPQCPSPNAACTCGFSKLFWQQVRLDAELSAAGSNLELGNGLLPGCSAPATKNGRLAALNPVSGEAVEQ